MKSKAFKYVKEFTLKYLTENIDSFCLAHRTYGITPSIITDVINNKDHALEWVLGEMLNTGEFKEMGLIVLDEYDENYSYNLPGFHTVIYHIDNVYIRNRNTCNGYLKDHEFEFVLPYDKVIHTTEYRPIK